MRFRLAFATHFANVSLMLVFAFAFTFVACPAPTRAAPTNLRVAIFSGTGSEPDKILAMYRAVASLGHTPMAITRLDLVNGRLTRSNFDVLIIPPGESGNICGSSSCDGYYGDDAISLGSVAVQDAIRGFLNSGGGVVAEEAGAAFASANGDTLDIYAGNYTRVTNSVGRYALTITDSNFGSGSQQAWYSVGSGYFSVPNGATVVARDAFNMPVIVRSSYGSGRVILSSFVLELRGDSELDWTIWDNWAMGGSHPNSSGAWSLLGRMIGWAYNGDSSAPTINATPNPTGARVAVVATRIPDGGAWPGLIPALARSIEYSGHVPLAIRFQEIKNNRLTLSNFKVVTFPGGYAYGYQTGLAGHESKIRNFIEAGGGYYGICAGAFYAPDSIVWEGVTYYYPLRIYKGQDIGPIDDIAPWPQHTLTPMNVSGDPVIGNLGTMQQMYYGGGYHTIPTVQQQGAQVYTSAKFAYSGSASGKAGVVRYSYGKGHVVLVTTHPEARAGSTVDWTFWENYVFNSNTPLNNPDNPWQFVNAAFDNWLTIP